MANTVQIKRGNNTSVNAHTGPSGEIIYNLDTGRLHAQDGSTAGGKPHALISDVDLKANAAVNIIAGTGLTGGGTLAANRTLALSSASIASLAKADTAVQPAITITAGTGLTGGGTLAANRTVALNTASIASLGKADTALQAPGGAAGQILAKNSATTNDVAWVSSAAATAVSYGPQTLTVAQQTQARQNIQADKSYDSIASVAAATVPAFADAIRTNGYYAAGDGGGALYKRVATEPTHAGKVQSVDGAWWELANQDLNVKMFGAIGDYSSHPLSERFSTLSDAQEFYPDATSLTNEIDRCAIQAGIDYCNSRWGGTLYIPSGRYLIDKELIYKRYVYLKLERSTEIFAVADLVNLITTPPTGSAFEASEHQTIDGGTWIGADRVDNCVNFQNSNNIYFANFFIYDYKYHGLVLDKKGGHLIYHGQINSRIDAPLTTPTLTGILGDCSDTHIDDVVIVGNKYGVRGEFYNSKLTRVHPWNTDTQGRLTEGFKLSGNDCVLVACQVDGPFGSAYGLYNHRISLVGCSINYPSNFGTFDNQDDIVYIDGAYKVSVIGCTWMVENPAQRIRYEFAGNLTNLIAMGNSGENIVNPAPVSVTRRSSESVVNQMISGDNTSALNVSSSITKISSNKDISLSPGDSDTIVARTDGAVDFPRIGTTADASNAHLTTGNRLLRSTSSARYKTDIEPMDEERAEAVLNLDPIWYRSTSSEDNSEFSWYGLIAEDVAKIDPRFVNWGYLPEDYENIDGAFKLREGANLVPDGVSYDRLTVPLIYLLKKSNRKIEELENRLRALEDR